MHKGNNKEWILRKQVRCKIFSYNRYVWCSIFNFNQVWPRKSAKASLLKAGHVSDVKFEENFSDECLLIKPKIKKYQNNEKHKYYILADGGHNNKNFKALCYKNGYRCIINPNNKRIRVENCLACPRAKTQLAS